MAILDDYDFSPFDETDPDDFRPNSTWALLVDAETRAGGHVDNITVIVEDIAPGDRIPLHTHPIHEAIVIAEGTADVTLAGETRRVGRGAVVFIPAGTAHGTHNASSEPVRIHAVFPSEQIGIRYLERNPAPGTEGEEPQPPFTIDARAHASRALR